MNGVVESFEKTVWVLAISASFSAYSFSCLSPFVSWMLVSSVSLVDFFISSSITSCSLASSSFSLLRIPKAF
ncbi:hypothetical protein K7X08_000398 [Anisodus acutangulus]|uniref:Uncharacterized protein n=1 Tax=Anisodus acutangulus TaxID=402998 RepID=A0A9Q1M497_9SOLA|nr:hypothetical protein K7X08_000398 [Anisodus acutangulus]